MLTKNHTYGLLLTTSNQTVYTVPSNFNATVKSIYVNNQTTAPVKLNLDWYKALNSTYYTLAKDVVIYGNSLVQITDAFMLEKSDLIRGLASANTSLTITLYVEEEYIPQKL